MQLYNALTETDKQLMKEYIGYYTRQEPDKVNLKNLLQVWSTAKSRYLFHLFGNRLQVKIPVKFQKSTREQMNEIVDAKIDADLYELFSSLPQTAISIDYSFSQLFDIDILLSNIYPFEKPIHVKRKSGNHDIVLQKGGHIMKFLQKVCTEWIPDSLKYFEELRIQLSRIANEKEISGNLVFSIHPLDYLTMSDNGCGWQTCMVWGGKPLKEASTKIEYMSGSYRQGTIEMMNSYNTIVAYIESDKKWIPKGCSIPWSNKKWRELFIVDPSIIIGITGYPYHLKEAEKFCLDTLRLWATNNLHADYEKNLAIYNLVRSSTPVYSDTDNSSNCWFGFEASCMYNDFVKGENHYCYIATEAAGECIIDYSGPSECMCCGRCSDADFALENQILCDDCNDEVQCAVCYENIPLRLAYWIPDLGFVCPTCHERNISKCNICDCEKINFAMAHIEGLKQSYTLCPDCAYDFEKNYFKHPFKAALPINGEEVIFVDEDELTDEGKQILDPVH